jgi:tetratricopeptide (TPR) repeat protein
MRALTIVFLLAACIAARAQVHNSASSDAAQEAAVLFDRGQDAHQKGNLNSAVRLYTDAIEKDPNLFQAYYQRAVALLGLERSGEAESDFKKVIQLQPDFARAHRGLGRVLLDRGLTQEAKEEFEHAIDLDAKIEGVRTYYASALIKLGLPDRAIEQLKTAIQKGEASPLAYALLGLAEERTGKQTEALSDYSQALAVDPGEIIAREGRARIYEARSDLPNAIEDATAAYRQHPSPEAALKLAGLYFKAGKSDLAIQIYKDQVAQRPNDLGLHADLIHLMMDNGQDDAARSEVIALLKIAPRNTRLLLLAGDLFSKDDPEKAEGYYRTALEIEPGNTAALVQLAASQMRAKQYDQAIETAQKALANEPDNVPAHSSLATSLFELKQYAQAAPQFAWIVQKKPQATIAYYFLAISVDRLGDCYDALRTYQEFIKFADPAVNKEEIENATIRVSLLEKEAKHGRCKPPSKGGK